MPVISIGKFNFSLNVAGKNIKNVWFANENNEYKYEYDNGILNINVSELGIYRVIIVDFE